jgi:DNA invertase Pin-like site-specific DNA recombinase
MTAFIAYLRVSTQKQGASGLGMEAQQEAVRSFTAGSHTVIKTFVEVESGRNNERPQLAAAMVECRRTGATLLIAKLDRLARDVAFIATLMKSDVKFTAVDMPDADPFRLHIEAAIAEEEARKISARTKSALAAAKARGVVLGGFRGHVPSDAERGLAQATRIATADVRARSVVPTIMALKTAGAKTLRELADGLNKAGIATPRGGLWQPVQVQRVLDRAISGVVATIR